MIHDNLINIKATLPESVTLVVVTKFRPIADLEQAYADGERDFGENRPQEMVAKHLQLPPDVRWHQIGHLQSNKVRSIAPFVTMIHSVDSIRLAQTISDEAVRIGRVIDVLLELQVAVEDTKHGFSPDELTALVDSGAFDSMPGIRVCGVMAMASFTDNQEQIRGEFRAARAVYDHLKAMGSLPSLPGQSYLSMGMSGDYQLAVECGSNMVRIGSRVFA